MATESFLSEFPPITTEQWEHIIREKITGAEYASKLIWHPEEGFAVKPYYRADDLAGIQFLDAAPGTFPFVRGTRSDGDWRIREEIDLVDAANANSARRARQLSGGGRDRIPAPRSLEAPQTSRRFSATFMKSQSCLQGRNPGSFGL